MSPSLHSFLSVVESGSGGFHPKKFLYSICNQQSSLVGFSVIPFGTIWTAGHSKLVICDRNVNAEKCISILDQGLLPAFHSGMLHHHSTLFMQDGAPCHTAKNDRLAKEGIKRLPWPSQSPDMNPVKNLWAILDCALQKSLPKPSSNENLINCLRSVWAEIPQETIAKLIKTMPERPQALRCLKGKFTCH